MVKPIDFGALTKGQHIGVETLEVLFNEKAGSPEYSFAIMALIEDIKDCRADLYPRQSGCGIHICTDAEGAEYNRARLKKLARQVQSTNADAVRVNPENLSEQERRTFEATRTIGAAMALDSQRHLVELRRAAALKHG